MELSTVISLIPLGIITGAFGGFFGLGGGLLLIPALTLLLGSHPQLYQSVSFLVATLVAAASLRVHLKARAVVKGIATRVGAASVCFAALGVFASNSLEPEWFNRIFACFLLYVAIYELVTLTRISRETKVDETESSAPRNTSCFGVGAAIGSISGLLGVGGGVIAVPLYRMVFRLPIRQAVGTSTATILPTLVVGGAIKLISVAMGVVHEGGVTLSSVADTSSAAAIESSVTVAQVLLMAAVLAPGAVIGARIGTGMLHRVSPRKAALAFALLLLFLAARMAGIL